MQLVLALVLWLKKAAALPLTPLLISGEENAIMDIRSHSFGSNTSRFYKMILTS